MLRGDSLPAGGEKEGGLASWREEMGGGGGGDGGLG